jgi:hypothetical protein
MGIRLLSSKSHKKALEAFRLADLAFSSCKNYTIANEVADKLPQFPHQI